MNECCLKKADDSTFLFTPTDNADALKLLLDAGASKNLNFQYNSAEYTPVVFARDFNKDNVLPILEEKLVSFRSGLKSLKGGSTGSASNSPSVSRNKSSPAVPPVEEKVYGVML